MYHRQRTLAVLFFTAGLISSCTTDPLATDFSPTTDHERRWAAFQLHDYTMIQQRICECLDGGVRYRIAVRRDRIVAVVNETTGEPVDAPRWSAFRTVTGLFATIRTADTTHIAFMRVEYDSTFGYPRHLFIDPNATIADEEYGYVTELR